MGLLLRLRDRVIKREPDFVIGKERDVPYLRRWWVIPRNKWFNIYLHHFCRSDDDRALHDHPWLFNASILIEGTYREHVPADPANPAGAAKVKVRKPGRLYFRWGNAPHRVELYPMLGYENRGQEQGVWTLFITGNKVREWGFFCPKGWRHWAEFTKPNDTGKSGEVGEGCGS